MSFENSCFDTDATLITMGMLRLTSHSANPTLVTVVLSLVLVIQENTDGAPIGPHYNIATLTDLMRILF
jgi:hypothetical protein